MNGFKKTALAATAALVLGFGATANATMIDGSLSFSTGGFNPTGGTDINDATGIDFDPTGTGVGSFSIDQVSNDFDTFINVGDTGVIKDFTFAPLAGTINDFWTVGGFSFALESANIIFQGFGFLNLQGTGTVTGNGFDATSGEWKFSGNASGVSLSWSGSSSATPVPTPEPGTMLLLGSGLLGLGLWRKLKK